MGKSGLFLSAICLLAPAIQAGTVAPSLLTVGVEKSSSVCCLGKGIKSCSPATVAHHLIGSETLQIVPGGPLLSLSNTIAPNPNAYHYTTDTAQTVLVHNPSTGAVHAHQLVLATGQSFVLEFCGEDVGHVWKEIDVKNLPEDVGVQDTVSPPAQLFRPNVEALRRTRHRDTDQAATYSIKVYYTPQFASATPDVQGVVDLAVAETNQGYANSGIDASCYALCTERATINDQDDGSSFLSAFRNMKSSVPVLRDSADAAVLLALNFESCGIGYVDTTTNGLTLSVTMKSCATGYYSFGHEIGHNFGCAHNPEESSNSHYPYGHAHLIDGGYRTVLAYTATGHKTRVNYYSNPSVILAASGTPTGRAGLSENFKVINENRFNMESIGNDGGCTIQA